MVHRRVWRALMLAIAALIIIIGIGRTVSTANHGEEARWMVQSSKWATLSWLEGQDQLQSMAMSIASSDEGRIFLYLKENLTFNKASLTFSEAQIEPSLFFGAKCGPDGALDPQDPRCAKLTISGVVSPVEEDSKQHALDVLFAAHPQMAEWPSDRNFIPCEMTIHEESGLWMISNFGGGGIMPANEYYQASPVRHASGGFDFGVGGNRGLSEAASAACYDPGTHVCECVDEKCGDANCQAAGGIWTTECNADCQCDPDAFTPANDQDATLKQGEPGEEHSGEWGEHKGHDKHGGEYAGHGDYGGDHYGKHKGEQGGEMNDSGDGGGEISFPLLPRPNFDDDHVGHARWMVSKSLWTTLSTISSKDQEQPFGNIRSVVDGLCLMASSGLPIFYLPTPDPSTLDIKNNKKIALSFTESALAETLSSDGHPCGGKDAEYPTCAKLTLVGHAKLLEDESQIEHAKEAFKANHPRASWLSKGGAHTGGNYYTLDLLEIMFLREFGGSTHITPDDYLKWKPNSSNLPGEAQCSGEYDKVESESQSQQSMTASSLTSLSAIVLIMITSFIGSFAGGIFSDRLKQFWLGRHSAGYSKANSAENSLELTATVV